MPLKVSTGWFTEHGKNEICKQCGLQNIRTYVSVRDYYSIGVFNCKHVGHESSSDCKVIFEHCPFYLEFLLKSGGREIVEKAGMVWMWK